MRVSFCVLILLSGVKSVLSKKIPYILGFLFSLLLVRELATFPPLSMRVLYVVISWIIEFG